MMVCDVSGRVRIFHAGSFEPIFWRLILLFHSVFDSVGVRCGRHWVLMISPWGSTVTTSPSGMVRVVFWTFFNS